jgi:hypothetical protein
VNLVLITSMAGSSSGALRYRHAYLDVKIKIKCLKNNTRLDFIFWNILQCLAYFFFKNKVGLEFELKTYGLASKISPS